MEEGKVGGGEIVEEGREERWGNTEGKKEWRGTNEG